MPVGVCSGSRTSGPPIAALLADALGLCMLQICQWVFAAAPGHPCHHVAPQLTGDLGLCIFQICQCVFAAAPDHPCSHMALLFADDLGLCMLQICQWVFAAAPGHPALREVAEHIAHTLHITFDQNTNRDTLERTGPGVWTDKLLKYAQHNPPSKVRTPPLPSADACSSKCESGLRNIFD